MVIPHKTKNCKVAGGKQTSNRGDSYPSPELNAEYLNQDVKTNVIGKSAINKVEMVPTLKIL